MKSIEDLKKLIPTIVEQITREDHNVGKCHYEKDEDGWNPCSDYETNYFTFEKDGWLIEATYECCGEWEIEHGDYWTPPSSELTKAWGSVTELSAIHCDESTGEETEFESDDLIELWDAMDNALENIA